MKAAKFLTVLMLGGAFLFAAAASAQQQVMYQQRFFEKYGDGSLGSFAVPCCTPNGTFDQRVTGRNDGPYFSEYQLRTQNWYGTYQPTGGVTLQQGAFTTINSNSFTSPGGTLLQIDTTIMRTVQDLIFKAGSGPGNYTYTASLPQNQPSTPTFRSSGTFVTPSNAGLIKYTAGPNQYGGTRAIIHNQFAHGFVAGSAPGLLNEFSLQNVLGPGEPATPQGIARRATRTLPFRIRTGSFSGPIQVSIPGTAWFTIFPYTTGTVNALANTIGTEVNNFTTRTDVGFNSIMETAMGGITGQLQLVAGHLLNSRGAQVTSQAGTNLTIITFMPEPGSAALIGAGAVALAGLVLHNRRYARA